MTLTVFSSTCDRAAADKDIEIEVCDICGDEVFGYRLHALRDVETGTRLDACLDCFLKEVDAKPYLCLDCGVARNKDGVCPSCAADEAEYRAEARVG